MMGGRREERIQDSLGCSVGRYLFVCLFGGVCVLGGGGGIAWRERKQPTGRGL